MERPTGQKCWKLRRTRVPPRSLTSHALFAPTHPLGNATRTWCRSRPRARTRSSCRSCRVWASPTRGRQAPTLAPSPRCAPRAPLIAAGAGARASFGPHSFVSPITSASVSPRSLCGPRAQALASSSTRIGRFATTSTVGGGKNRTVPSGRPTQPAQARLCRQRRACNN